MCGIFLSLSCEDFRLPSSATTTLLNNRGPDDVGIRRVLVPQHAGQTTPALHAVFLSTVLALRGTSVVKQPLQDDKTTSVLCWNGEAWSIGGHQISGNDSQAVFYALMAASSSTTLPTRQAALQNVSDVLSSIRGPYAMIFYDAPNQYIFYGRDCLGRRSLLRNHDTGHALMLSSVRDNLDGNGWSEVDADGLYVVDLMGSGSRNQLSILHIPHRRVGQPETRELHLNVPFPPMNRSITPDTSVKGRAIVQELYKSLKTSIALRVQNVREVMANSNTPTPHHEAKVAILFSGGLDCTILAKLTHEIIPVGQSIDLLNVAFENPRVCKTLATDQSPYELCPDRITGKASHAELKKTCAERIWRFIAIDVPHRELQMHREAIISLMYPHDTEMDLSIACALYFASRGEGIIQSAIGDAQFCKSSAHVLLSGLGADELFGGYQRHASAFSRHGYEGLVEELELDFNRLGKRNLGRDDRVICNAGKEARFPYLDEEFITFALGLSVFAKCDFGLPITKASIDPAHFLEPGKRLLRLLAWELGLKKVAMEKKRAIQFGARTAKMVAGRTKGTHVVT